LLRGQHLEKKDSLAGLKVDDDVPTGMNGVVVVFGFTKLYKAVELY
jgi:hypothetical protein